MTSSSSPPSSLLSTLLTPSLLLTSLCLGACGGDELASVVVSPTQGGEARIAGTETGITIPEGAVELETTVTVELGDVDAFAPLANTVSDVVILEPLVALDAVADYTIEMPEGTSPSGTYQLRQFIDGVWIQPEIGAVEIGSGNIAYGSISLLAPTVVIELSRE